MIVLTHRGLEPSKQDFFPESSFEAFQNHLERGFGIEFDINFINDKIVISHSVPNEDSPSFSEILNLIKKYNPEISAIHLKGKFQDEIPLDLIVKELENHNDILSKLIIFDVKPDAARYLKSRIPELKIAPSVAHDYDIERYNSAVSGTLISLSDAIRFKNEDLYEWVWLDEWDLADKNENTKKFYTQEVFDKLHSEGYKIALVTPELHATSPGLLGGESHEDAKTKEALFKRIKEIISLKPDAICTDYPEEALNIIQ